MNIEGKHFYFVRHAETDWNTLQMCQGWKDIELSDRGKQSSLEMAKKLEKMHVECICSSPLKRASQTADMIYQHHPNAQFNLIDELKERFWGNLEGVTSEKMYEVEKMEESNSKFIPGFGVEDRSVFKKRIVEGLNKAFQFHSFPLIVSHGRLFLSLCEVLGMPIIRQISNLSLLEVRYEGSRWSCKTVDLDDF